MLPVQLIEEGAKLLQDKTEKYYDQIWTHFRESKKILRILVDLEIKKVEDIYPDMFFHYSFEVPRNKLTAFRKEIEHPLKQSWTSINTFEINPEREIKVEMYIDTFKYVGIHFMTNTKILGKCKIETVTETKQRIVCENK